MKRILTLIFVLTAALIGTSCGKEQNSKEDFSKVANVRITTKGDQYDDTVTMFQDATIYRHSDDEGQSWFCAMSGGKMVYDAFMLSIYFNNIDNLAVGDPISPSRFFFTFYFSSNSNAWTQEYEGSITLADKGEDYAVLHFDNVVCSCLYGDYLIDGYLECSIFEEHISPES